MRQGKYGAEDRGLSKVQWRGRELSRFNVSIFYRVNVICSLLLFKVDLNRDMHSRASTLNGEMADKLSRIDWEGYIPNNGPEWVRVFALC